MATGKTYPNSACELKVKVISRLPKAFTRKTLKFCINIKIDAITISDRGRELRRSNGKILRSKDAADALTANKYLHDYARERRENPRIVISRQKPQGPIPLKCPQGGNSLHLIRAHSRGTVWKANGIESIELSHVFNYPLSHHHQYPSVSVCTELHP